MRSTYSANQRDRPPPRVLDGDHEADRRPGTDWSGNGNTSSAPTSTEKRNASARMAASLRRTRDRTSAPGPPALPAEGRSRRRLAYDDLQWRSRPISFSRGSRIVGWERRTWRAPARAARRDSSRSSGCRGRRPAMPEVVRTFLESARAGALLSHANVATGARCGRLGSSYFVASEYVDGELLRSIIEHAKAQGRLQVPLRAVLTIVRGHRDRAALRARAQGRRRRAWHRPRQPVAVERVHQPRRRREARRFRRAGGRPARVSLAGAAARRAPSTRAAIRSRSASCCASCSRASRCSSARQRRRDARGDRERSAPPPSKTRMDVPRGARRDCRQAAREGSGRSLRAMPTICSSISRRSRRSSAFRSRRPTSRA